ncbi:MAG TPA: family 78 glycoside hydrolase catalytic domain [Candidatus Acidoferrales bacterium]|nr:family 78 glycoside hydrolase catalytic domain [Candidatus Acidoferrales bacterium]
MVGHAKLAETVRTALSAGLAGILLFLGSAGAYAQANRPEKLQCESLTTPLGMDAEHPLLSWQLRDTRQGARQSAYEVQVASSAGLLASGKADVWDSGRINSDNSNGVSYGGKSLEPMKRYFWRVLVWDADGKPYPASEPTWWETGLLKQENWKAKWIGYEEAEHRAVRESGAQWITNEKGPSPEGESAHHAFRLHFALEGTVRHATLYVTGEETAGAWLNGKQVAQVAPLPPWKQMPWKTYTLHDVRGDLRSGQNVLAVDVVRYAPQRRSQADLSQAPMNALLYLEKSDGRSQIIKTGDAGWKAALDPSGDWREPAYNDSAWADAVEYAPTAAGFEGPEVGSPWPTGSVKALRRTFEVTSPVASARIYSTALGAYKLWLNGQPVGNEILAPGWTDFRQQLVYQAHDVTAQLKAGKNAIGAFLAPGWYATPLQWFGQGFNYGSTPPALRVQIHIVYKNGSSEDVLSDEMWKAAVSPISTAEIYDGETRDARREQAGWNTASFSDEKWKPVDVTQPHEPKIVWQYFQPIRAERNLTAKTTTNPSPGTYIFDFGQNLSGVARIRVKGAAGSDVKLRFAEVLNPDGTLYVENLRTAKATDHFVLSGNGEETFQPLFTYHGFRYVEVSGIKSREDLKDIQAVAFRTDAPFTSELKTGSPMVDKLWSNILWGQRSNFVGVPTDCPQRDERLGWSADAQVFWRAASYNMDLRAFSQKYSADLRGTQSGTAMYGIFAPGTNTPHPGYGTGWSDAGVIVPWTSWIQTGNREVIEENWEAMEKYLGAIEKENPDHLWRKNYGIPFADWLAPEGVTPVDLIATAYWAYDVDLMGQMAHATGRTAEEQRYKQLFEEVRAAFDKAYVHSDGWVGGVPPQPVFASGTERKLSNEPVETQTGYVLALHMKLLPEELRAAAAQLLVKRIEANHWRLGTGFLGTPYLLGVLTDTGHADVAYRLLLNTDYPSWGYLVDHGATTMWERWNGDQMRGDPSMNSYNHYAYGAVADWIYRYAAGIDTLPEAPGFHKILLHPNFDGRLGSIDFSYQSSYGSIHSAWSVAGKRATWKLIIPPNATGVLPLTDTQAKNYQLDGEGLSKSTKVHALQPEQGREVFEIPAGTYQFTVALP